jgi:hypothetical protein
VFSLARHERFWITVAAVLLSTVACAQQKAADDKNADALQKAVQNPVADFIQTNEDPKGHIFVPFFVSF